MNDCRMQKGLCGDSHTEGRGGVENMGITSLLKGRDLGAATALGGITKGVSTWSWTAHASIANGQGQVYTATQTFTKIDWNTTKRYLVDNEPNTQKQVCVKDSTVFLLTMPCPNP